MVQVPDWSKDEFENRSNALARLIRLAWRAIARAFAGRLENQVVATSADVAGLPAAWDMEVEAQILGYITDTYMDAAGKVRAAVDAPDDFLLTDDLVSAYLRTARNRLTGIGDDVWDVVANQLIQGMSAGESIPELAARVRNTASVSDARALTIARTEVHAAHEAGSYDQALFVDPDASKIWLATDDARTRPTHDAAEGQRRKINEPFSVGGAALRYPGDPLGPADEVINCRCTTVYDFATVDSVTSDDPELALVAASKKKWTPSKHPRGSDGRFIKKGAVVDFLAKPKPDIPSLSKAVNELTVGSWKKLTEAQRDYFQDSVDKLPKGTDIHTKFSQKLADMDIELGLVDAAEKKLATEKAAPAVEVPEAAPEPVKAKVLAQAAPKTNKAAQTILETDDFAQLGNQKYKKPLGKTGKPLRVGFLGDDGSITAHVGSKPGDPAKVSTFLIWGKYPPGTTILESADGTDSVVWNGKKFDFRTNGQTTKTLGKQDTYDTLHSQTGWKVPKYEGQPVDQPGVLTELVEGYEPDDDQDTDLPTAPESTPAAEAEPEPAAPEVPDAPVSEAVSEPVDVAETPAEPDFLQQLMDAVPETDPYAAALFKLKSTDQISNAEAVQIAQGMTQEEWNGLTLNQRSKIALGTDQALDDLSIESQSAWLAFNKVSEFQAKQTEPVAGPPPVTKIDISPVPELSADPDVITDEGEWVAIAAHESYPAGSVVAETTDGEFKLVKGHTANTWQLKDYQDQTITSLTDADVEAGQAQAETPFHEWKAVTFPEPPAAPEPVIETPAPALADMTPDGDEDILNSEAAWDELLSDLDPVTKPTVIAQTKSGKNRLVANPGGQFAIEWDVDGNGTWIDIETFTPDSLYDNGQTFDELMSSHSYNWVKTPKLEEPVPIAVDVIEVPDGTVWQSTSSLMSSIGVYVDHPHPAGTVMALRNQDGVNIRIVATGQDGKNAYKQQLQSLSTGEWKDFDPPLNMSAQTVKDTVAVEQWLVPTTTFDTAMNAFYGPTPSESPSAPELGAPVIELPTDTIYTPVVGLTPKELNQYISFTHPPGTIVAHGFIDQKLERIVATGLGSPKFKLQQQETDEFGSKVWVDAPNPELIGADVKDAFLNDPWLVPLPTFKTVQAANTLTPAAPMVELDGDTSSIPLSAKKAWKKKLSAAKVGYYSKPEKIWDQIKEIQGQYPDPMNPGQSKLTPLQVMKSLDEVYTGKTLVSPYESKMVPWAATPKGMAYTNNPGVPQTISPGAAPAAQTAPSPTAQLMEKTPGNLDKIFVAALDMEPGTVLATNPGDGNVQYQIVVGADPNGVKAPQMQYKSSMTQGKWVNSVAFPSPSGFASSIDVEFNNQPWKLAVVQLPSGGIAPVMGAAIPAPAPPTIPTLSVSVPTTFTSAKSVWSKIDELPEDTVVATNPGGLNEYRMVVKFDPLGMKYVQIQRKVKTAPDDSPWVDVLDLLDTDSFHSALNDSLGGNDWTLFDPQPDVPAVTPTVSAPSGAPVPKPFKMTVKAIYAAMPALKNGQIMASGEYNGKKYALVVGYGLTPSGGYSKKKKLLLKTQMPSGYWATVEPLGTQAKLGTVLKDHKYGWIEAQELPAVPPPSVASPVTAPKPTTPDSMETTYPATDAGVEDLWNHLDEMGDGTTIATAQVFGETLTLKSSIKNGKNVIVSVTEKGTETIQAKTVEELKNVLVGDLWTIKAAKSPLYGQGEIADLSEDKKQDLYKKFKQQPSTYLDSPTDSIYNALKYIADENGVTLLQMIRVVDDIGAKKVSKPDEHLFEKKIKDWLKTPQGAAVALGKPIPLPDNPDFLPTVDPKKIMPLEQSDKLSYQVISVDKAKKLNAEFKAASPAGKWTAAQEHGIAIYTGGTYIPINNYYRGKTTDISAANEKAARETQQAMRPSTVPMLLHRGVGYDGVGGSNSHADIEKKVGQTWRAGGFFSASAGGAAAFGGPVLIEVEAPPGTPMTYVDSPSDVSSSNCVSSNCGEREMLLGAGLHYKILSVKYENGKSVVRMRVVPTPDEEEE